MDTQDFIAGVLAKNRRIVAKTITLIESSLPAHQEKAKVIIDALLPYAGKAAKIFIFGGFGMFFKSFCGPVPVNIA